MGDNSYIFENILTFFQKSAHFTPPNNHTRFANSTPLYETAAFDNSLGRPLQVSYPNYASPIASWLQMGQEQAGIPISPGFSSGQLNGSQWNEQTINLKNKHRSSSKASYLNATIANTTLKVYTHTLARCIS